MKFCPPAKLTSSLRRFGGIDFRSCDSFTLVMNCCPASGVATMPCRCISAISLPAGMLTWKLAWHWLLPPPAMIVGGSFGPLPADNSNKHPHDPLLGDPPHFSALRRGGFVSPPGA